VWAPEADLIKQGKLDDAAIDKLVASTEPMIAKRGRASYLGEKSVGHIDPGAASTGELLKAYLDATA
ncbi:DAK2 domain-containing protein, partial [Lactiplantibacillus plantarum]|uniref:DAK2 domain-containing protein n=1 Tax=Lactiplantibacillus plantarum TaxID=1590 RepID=UPI000A976691